MHIAFDPGSTFSGKFDYAEELICIASTAGADSIKFQLFGEEHAKNGNVMLPMDWVWPLIKTGEKYGIPVAFSVFDQRRLEYVLQFKTPYIKFAYSERHKVDTFTALCNRGIKVVVSSSPSEVHLLPDHPGLTKLVCYPEYPKTEVIHFEGLFPLFDGFSDHTLGLGQSVEACKHGAQWFEKHIKLEYADVTCPDAVLPHSLNASRAKDYVEALREMDIWVRSQHEVWS